MVLFKQKPKAAGKLLNLPLSAVVPCSYQPRQSFDSAALEELAESIRRHGVLQPVPVRDIGGGKYELVAGERRLRASALAGMSHIPALLTDYSLQDVAALALVENLQRCDLHFFDEAVGIARLITENNLTQEETSRILGKNQSTIANKLRLLKLNEDVRSVVQEARLTERHARALLRLPEEKRGAVLNKIISGKLNVHDTDLLIERVLAPAKPTRKYIIKDVRIFLNTVNKALSIMKASGVAADSDLLEKADCYEYWIKIPK